MKIKAIVFSLVLALAGSGTSSALLITDFGTDHFEVLEYGGDSMDQDATSLTLSGSVLSLYLIGTFAPVDIGEATGISLTGWVNGADPDATLMIYLSDSALTDTRIYSVPTSSFGSESSTVLLTLEDFGNGVTEIGDFEVRVSGFSSDSLSFTFGNLQAIPEPSVYALSAVILGAAAWLRRRRYGTAD